MILGPIMTHFGHKKNFSPEMRSSKKSNNLILIRWRNNLKFQWNYIQVQLVMVASAGLRHAILLKLNSIKLSWNSEEILCCKESSGLLFWAIPWISGWNSAMPTQCRPQISQEVIFLTNSSKYIPRQFIHPTWYIFSGTVDCAWAWTNQKDRNTKLSRECCFIWSTLTC